jgi:hypothetical protein
MNAIDLLKQQHREVEQDERPSTKRRRAPARKSA